MKTRKNIFEYGFTLIEVIVTLVVSRGCRSHDSRVFRNIIYSKLCAHFQTNGGRQSKPDHGENNRRL